MDSSRVKQWKQQLEDISVWLDRAESTMGIANYESSANDVSPWDTLSLDEQQILLEVKYLLLLLKVLNLIHILKRSF